MHSRSLAFEKFDSYSWKSSFRDCEVGTSRFSMGRNGSFLFEKSGILSRSSSLNYGSNYKPTYKCKRPSLSARLENPGKYSKEEEEDKFYIKDNFNIDEEEDNDINLDNSNCSRLTNEAPDFLFGPLSSRIPKKRNIISIDEETTSKKANTVTFDRLGKKDKKFVGPPLRQLKDIKFLPGFNRKTLKGVENTDIINYNEMSDHEFEKNCWLAVFGSSIESEKIVLKYLTENVGGIKVVGKRRDTNYFYVRMANPLLVKKACELHVYFFNDKEIIGFTKPMSYSFLDNPDFKFEDLPNGEEESTSVPKKSSIRVVSIHKKPFLLREEIRPKDNGFISKIWDYVNN